MAIFRKYSPVCYRGAFRDGRNFQSQIKIEKGQEVDNVKKERKSFEN